jgi:hypothetical protein
MTHPTDTTTNTPETTGADMPDATTPEDAMTPPTESQRESMTDDEESMADTQRMLTPDDVARAMLTSVACELGEGELRVLTRIAERLKSGQTVYGLLHLADDAREFRNGEAREEIEDALVYLACAWLKAEAQEVNG